MRSSSPRAHLAVASTAVLLTAADTYVVVLALTDMMAGVGLGIESLHRATPIVSGFLVGYVATLPLIGRLADLVSRRQALGWCLLVFTVGSVITALASDLGVLVAGRVIQGVGGGGLVPATLALVADQWPPERRGAPLGVVGAVQELGAVAGPVVGAAILAIGDWRLIFWFGAIAGIALYAVLRLLPAAAELASPGGVPVTPPAPDVVHRRSPPGVHAEASSAPSVSVPAGPEAWALPTPSVSVPPGPEISTPPRAGRSGARLVAEARPGAAGRVMVGLLTVFAGALGVLTLTAPQRLVGDLTFGLAFIPLGGSGLRVATPIGVATLALGVGLTAYLLWRSRRLLMRADLPSAGLLALALGAVIVAFSSGDPERAVIGPSAITLVPLAVVAAALAVWRMRRVREPLIAAAAFPRLTRRAAVVSVCVGVALVAVVVDVPVYARLTVAQTQTAAAFVLLRFLVAVPVGALIGGWLTRRLSYRVLTVGGLVAASAGLAGMSQWTGNALETPSATGLLVLVGFGLGLTLAPVNAAALHDVAPGTHGVAGSIIVVARMIGMVVGLAVLTSVGLHAYYAAVAALPDPTDVRALLDAAVVQVQWVFRGAAIAAGVGALLAAAGLGQHGGREGQAQA